MGGTGGYDLVWSERRLILKKRHGGQVQRVSIKRGKEQKGGKRRLQVRKNGYGTTKAHGNSPHKNLANKNWKNVVERKRTWKILL